MIEQNGARLTPTGPMLIANARALLETGRSFLQGAAPASEVLLDLSAVEETDSSALSVVFALLRTANKCGVTLRLAHAPASMLSQAALYGVAESLPLA
jgi:phospholipid transport system transporter-binding protein